MIKILVRIFLMTSALLFCAYVVVFWTIRAPVFTQPQEVSIPKPPSSDYLRVHVETLSTLVPNRSVHNPDSLNEAARYINEEFSKMGYQTETQNYSIKKLETHNIIAKFLPKGVSTNSPWIIVGAHYDVAGTQNPGADDNASGVAGLLELARLFKENSSQARFPIQFVAYSTEEPPFFAGDQMGSAIHAEKLVKENRGVRLMYSLEMIGFFSEELFSQKFPVPLLYLYYPWRGNFIGIVSNLGNQNAVKDVKTSFMAIEGLSTYSINAPESVVGIDFSDHRNYWEKGWPAVMITDTSFLRNEEYHMAGDTADRLDYEKMALIVKAMFQSINDLR